MRRLKKLLGILIILGIVFFIICDEKGYQVEWQDNHIFLKKIEKKFEPKVIDQQIEKKNVVYKDLDWIHINYEFENPKALSKADGMDPEYLAKDKEEKRLEKEAKLAEQTPSKASGPNIISLKDDDIVSIFDADEEPENDIQTGENVQIEDEEIPEIIYKNSTRIKLYSGFETPISLRKGEYIYTVETDNIEEDTIENEENNEELNSTSEDENDASESSNLDEAETIGLVEEDIPSEETEISTVEIEDKEKIEETEKEPDTIESDNTDEKQEDNTAESEESAELLRQEKEAELHEIIGKYIRNNVTSILTKAEKIEIITEEIVEDENEEEIENLEESEKVSSVEIEDKEEIEETEKESDIIETNNTDETQENNTVESEGLVELLRQEKEAKLRKIIGKYIRNNVTSILRRAESIQPSFVIDKTDNNQEQEIGTSNEVLEKLLANEEIDIDTLESENDEFLLKIFQQTKDEEVMNLIVENYLNEYQFIKAKKFIENLPEQYRDRLEPSLNLRVAFNSFALTSKNINEPLKLLVQDYLTKGEISNEDANRYLGVIALMNRNYDDYFQIASGFTLDKYTTFTSKLQGYKDQIAKQMGMPDYYFDTLVSLELFNQGLFQPAKVVALSSLQYNSNYILPYQVLAYANFLTNSRDTSNEYFKKLIDLDPNNAEKYRFLMGVAYYRNEQYEQSVVMLSMIKDENLRLDTQRYLINDYLKLAQKNKLISIRNKLLGYENLVASDFYTYFYEAFYHPFADGQPYQIYIFDTELANKMVRVCSMKLSDEEKAVCNYGMIGKNIAMGQFEGLEDSLLKLTTDYPQGYLYHALGEYYIQQGDTEKAKVYLLKAVSLSQNKSEKTQIKKLLQETM